MLMHPDSIHTLNTGESQLDHLLNELICSELDYLNDLRMCQNFYIMPLSKTLDVKAVFLNWSGLIEKHESILDRLLGRLGCRNDGFFKSLVFSEEMAGIVFEAFETLLSSIVESHTEFCSHQTAAVRHLESKIASDIRFKQLLSECQRKLGAMIEANQDASDGSERPSRALQNSKLPLVSFFLKPMQRITKYDLMFERMSKLVERESPMRKKVEQLQSTARALCNRVNEACRFKQDNEENLRTLRWCQTHIKQPAVHIVTSPSIIIRDRDESRNSESHNQGALNLGQVLQRSPYSDVSPADFGDHEFIAFETDTNLLGQRRFIKAASLFKLRNGRELVAFLFNDILILTSIKGGVSLRLSNDLLKSERAKQAYYKLYKHPILMADLHVLTEGEMEEEQSKISTITCSPSFTNSSQSIVHKIEEITKCLVCFRDSFHGTCFNLLAPDEDHSSDWLRTLDELSTQARQARDLRALEQSLASCPFKAQNYIARLSIKILDLNLQRNSEKELERTRFRHTLGGDPINIAKIRPFSSGLNVGHKFCIRSQMKRYQRSRAPSSDSSEQGRTIDVIPLSEVFRTKTVDICCAYNYGEFHFSSFGDQFFQFLVPEKTIHSDTETSDYIEIEFVGDHRFRENIVVGRKRLSIDDLLGHDSQKPIVDIFDVDSLRQSTRSRAPSLTPDHSVDMSFKLRPIKHSSSEQSSAPSTVYSPTVHSNGSPTHLTSAQSMSRIFNYKVSLRVRLHLEFICDRMK